MKKSILLFAVGLGLLTSCDPIKEEKEWVSNDVSVEDLKSAVKITQMSSDPESPESNNFTFQTNPEMLVSIFVVKDDGSENLLAFGRSGEFKYAPSRGSDPNVVFHARTIGGADEYVTTDLAGFTVYVPAEMSYEQKLIASESGRKVWKWDPSITGAVWGNMGYCGGAGSAVGLNGEGQWWGVTSEEEFAGQLGHSDTGQLTGEESMDATMVMTEDGQINCYDANGNLVRSGSYEVVNFDNSDPGAWKVGDLKTSAGAILWPFEINSGGNKPTLFEIVYLTVDKMTLVYPDGGDFGGLGNWGEASFWHFKSDSDVAGALTDYNEAGKAWTWDPSVTGAVWGNMGYCGGKGSAVGQHGEGQWWGVTSEEDFAGQLGHSDTGALTGEESMDAYMIFTPDGTINSYGANGDRIRGGNYEVELIEGNEWKVANLNTTAGSILWPFEINSGGNKPTTFEVVYLTGDKMTLVYPDGGDFGGLGNWGEASFWHFKAK